MAEFVVQVKLRSGNRLISKGRIGTEFRVTWG